MKRNWLNISKTIYIPEGEIIISGAVSYRMLEDLSIDIMLKAFRPAKRQKEALIEISKMCNGKVVSAHIGKELIGYVTFHPPDDFERWSLGPKEVLELGAVEVAPKMRKYGIASNMLEVAFEDEMMENYIIVATEYYWHWDLEQSGLHVWEYRELMRNLMEKAGLVLKDTDDEEINSHPANMLMVRYGKKLKPQTIQAFEEILFIEEL